MGEYFISLFSVNLKSVLICTYYLVVYNFLSYVYKNDDDILKNSLQRFYTGSYPIQMLNLIKIITILLAAGTKGKNYSFLLIAIKIDVIITYQ